MKRKLKCNCGLKNKIVCKYCSSTKMVMLLKNGNNALKYKTVTNRYANPVWYNQLAINNKSPTSIIEGMHRRYKNSKYYGKTNKLMFYDNQTKVLLRIIETKT